MSAFDALEKAHAAGVLIGIDGGDLVLEAPVAPPSAVLEALSRNKANIIALLRSSNSRCTGQDWQAFFKECVVTAEFDHGMSRSKAEEVAHERCIVEWLNRNVVTSTSEMCAWCGRREKTGAPIVPFGAAPHGHIWLHGGCWNAWYYQRLRQARDALSLMSIGTNGLDRFK